MFIFLQNWLLLYMQSYNSGCSNAPENTLLFKRLKYGAVDLILKFRNGLWRWKCSSCRDCVNQKAVSPCAGQHLSRDISTHFRRPPLERARARAREGRGGVERERCASSCEHHDRRRNGGGSSRRFLHLMRRAQRVERTFMSEFRGGLRSRSLLKCVQERGGVLLSALCAPPCACVS